jgi:RND family efflux transporter MFP subunit
MNHAHFIRLLPACTALALAAAPLAQAAPALGCLIEAERIAEVGSPVVGVVDRIEVERGDRVVKGQVLALLRAPVERASLSVARSRAESSAELQAAVASAQYTRERLVRTENLFREQFVSEQAVNQARTEADLAEHKLAQAREQRQMSGQERDVAAAQVWQRVIRSPIDGVVAERYVSAGERVDDKPLLRIAKVEPLRVQLVVPVALYNQVQPGGLARVLPELPGAQAQQARVTMIDKVVDAASNTFRVHLELPNVGGVLPAGLRCKAEFAAGPAQSAGATPMPAPAPATATASATALVPVSTAKPR